MYVVVGYVVVYVNLCGSISYGVEFVNLIYYCYLGEDYDDLMLVVDYVLEMNNIDEEWFFVIGGSGGGVLIVWIVGMIDWFCVVVVVKLVINWYSFVLIFDVYNFYYKYWFLGLFWEYVE